MNRGTGLRVSCLGLAAAALLIGGKIIVTHASMAGKSGGADVIKPFRVHFPDEALADLKHRVAATRWPDKEIVTDQSQGVQLATVQKLARYWATDYNWRKVEARLNALPQFTTEIDGVDIHFIHVRSKLPKPDTAPLEKHSRQPGWGRSSERRTRACFPNTNGRRRPPCWSASRA